MDCIWHPNPNLQMSEAEQEAANSKHHVDFCRDKYLRTAVMWNYSRDTHSG